MAGNTIYTDLSGTGYDLPGLQSAWNDPTFSSDPANARVGDILSSYGASSTPSTTSPASSTKASVYNPGTATLPVSPAPASTFTNTSPTKPSVPNGIPDPNNAGYDTAGYRLGSTDVNGVINIPNTATGQISTVIQNPTGQPNPNGNPFASFTSMPPAGTGTSTDTGGGTGGGGSSAATTTSSTAGTAGAPGTTGTDVNPNAYAPSPIAIDPATVANNQALRDFMTSQLGQLSTPIDPNNPEVKPAIDAFNAQQQRDLQTNRDAIAERYYASGQGGGALDTGSFNTAVQQQQEAAAADKANFSGSTIYNAGQAQRQQLQSMLNTAVQAGQTDVAQQIQAQIANIDAGLREQGLGQQNTQFNNTLDYNYANLIAQMNRDALIAGLTGQ